MDNIKITFPVDQTKGDPSTVVLAMEQGLTKLIDNGALRGNIDDILVDYQLSEDTGYAVAEIDGAAVVDASKLGEVGAGLVYNFNTEFSIDEYEEMKKFSVATIQDRLKISSYNPKVRFRYLVMDYKRYWNSKKSTLAKDKNKLEALKNIFLSDMTGLFTQVLPYIEEGKQLSQLVGVSTVSPKLTKVARDLSLVYRRALKANSTQGQIPKSIFSKLKTEYNKFMSELLLIVFPGIDEYLGSGSSESEVKTHSYSYCEDGRIKLF